MHIYTHISLRHQILGTILTVEIIQLVTTPSTSSDTTFITLQERLVEEEQANSELCAAVATLKAQQCQEVAKSSEMTLQLQVLENARPL
jgi:uncharacterized protein YgbK (DUF1537 family)